MAVTLFDAVLAFLPGRSSWRLGTSDSAEITASTPVARVSIAATGGVLYMGMGDSPLYYPYPYFGAGGSLGIGFSTPVSGSISSRNFLSTGGEFGRLYLPPQKQGFFPDVDVTKDSLAGPAILVSLGGQLTFGGLSVSVMLFGANAGSMGNSISITPLLYRCNALAFSIGTSMTAALGVGVTAHQLYVHPPGKIRRL